MLWTVPCFFLFGFQFMYCVSAGNQCREERSVSGMALQGFVFKKISVTALHECDISCEREMTCQSYNYAAGEKSCELNNRTKEARPENFRSAPAWFYKRRLSDRAPLGSIPELPAWSCQEIKASEGKDTISSKYWLDPTGTGTAVLVYCDMNLEDIDECITGNHDCDVNANCTNTVGGHNCTCKEGFHGNGSSCSALKNCADIYKSGEKRDGVYTIKPDNLSAFDVFCDQTTAGGGWTVFQKRQDGSVDFFLYWNNYKNGFGDLSGEFWLGNEKIHRLTSHENNTLRVDMADFEGNTAYAEYDKFGVTSENDKYKLILGSYSGNAGDSLSWHRGQPFSTRDQDNDNSAGNNCASKWHGAWWYNKCHQSNLNGIYRHRNPSPLADGVNWFHWKGHKYSLKRTEMKIRPVDF
ncbi:microfibril-associated glycoprotein 4-like [Oculina patagonica]